MIPSMIGSTFEAVDVLLNGFSGLRSAFKSMNGMGSAFLLTFFEGMLYRSF
jgi:hypothetical protein